MSRESGGPGFSRALGKSAILVFAIALGPPAMAQVTDTSQIDAYLKAITQSDTSSRLAALERFAATAPGSNLKVDALEWIVWDEKQTHNDAAAANWARKLLASDPDNALGLAISLQSESQRTPAASARNKPTKQLSDSEQTVKRGLASLPRLRRPEGMSHDEFSRLRQQVAGILNAAAGYAALERKDYPRARVLLGEAVKASPNDARLVYALALADLSGEKPDRQQGYWLLARAVNLSGGPSAAREVEEFGRKKYKEDGGNDRDWEQYLAVTAAPGANAAVVIVSVAPDAQTHRSKNSAAPSRGTRTSAKKSGKSKDKTEVAKNRAPARASKSGWKGEPEPQAESTAAANSLPPISDAATGQTRRTGPPVSLGILFETSMAGKNTRRAIVNSLTDLVRRLGPEDEAFILSFSHDLVFEEDLTGDVSRLEHALDQIKPNPGTALLDAAGFAAGHLRRIAKNDSRVLLVISDGKNASSRIPALASSSEIRASGVKIYCIGVDVNGTDSMYRLQGLASATGGTAAFVTAPNQFRAAAQQLAAHMGIRFDY
jgi:von Willebrand factor type A domain